MAELDYNALQRLADAATPIHDAPGYAVCQSGEILSVSHNWRGGGVRQVTPVAGKSGYLKVRLSVGGRRINRAVHRIVAEAYLSPRPSGAQVRHLDGNQLNNSAANLAWGTARENAQDRDQHGTTARGQRSGTSRITEEVVREVRRLRDAGLLYREIEDRTGVTRRHARQIFEREAWAHVD